MKYGIFHNGYIVLAWEPSLFKEGELINKFKKYEDEKRSVNGWIVEEWNQSISIPEKNYIRKEIICLDNFLDIAGCNVIGIEIYQEGYHLSLFNGKENKKHVFALIEEKYIKKYCENEGIIFASQFIIPSIKSLKEFFEDVIESLPYFYFEKYGGSLSSEYFEKINKNTRKLISILRKQDIQKENEE